MTDAPRTPPRDPAGKNLEKGQGREDRLKTALKANMARRKAQARAKAQRQNDGSGQPDRQENNE